MSFSGCLNLLNTLAQNVCVPALLQLCVLCPCIAFMVCQLRVKLQVELNLQNLYGAPLFDQPIVGSSESTYIYLIKCMKAACIAQCAVLLSRSLSLYHLVSVRTTFDKSS